mgnify:CR=1 FL=1
MPQIHKRLAQSRPAAGVFGTHYTAPALTTTIVTCIIICNVNASAVDSARVFVVPSGGTPPSAVDVDSAIIFNLPIPTGAPFVANVAQTLNPGDYIVVRSESGDLVFTSSGLEIT